MPSHPFARYRRGAIPLTLLLLAGCGAPVGSADPDSGPPSQLPAAVIALADPRQDLTTAYLNPEDGCYWYRYQGPVETTMLPLRTPDGNAICTQGTAG